MNPIMRVWVNCDIRRYILKILMCMCHKDKVTWGLLIGTWILSIGPHIIGLYCFICLFALASGIEICDIYDILMWYSFRAPNGLGKWNNYYLFAEIFLQVVKCLSRAPSRYLNVPSHPPVQFLSKSLWHPPHLLVRLIVTDFEKCPQISQ